MTVAALRSPPACHRTGADGESGPMRSSLLPRVPTEQYLLHGTARTWPMRGYVVASNRSVVRRAIFRRSFVPRKNSRVNTCGTTPLSRIHKFARPWRLSRDPRVKEVFPSATAGGAPRGGNPCSTTRARRSSQSISHARPGRTTACRRRPIASAPASLQPLGAPEAQRSASMTRRWTG